MASRRCNVAVCRQDLGSVAFGLFAARAPVYLIWPGRAHETSQVRFKIGWKGRVMQLRYSSAPPLIGLGWILLEARGPTETEQR